MRDCRWGLRRPALLRHTGDQTGSRCCQSLFSGWSRPPPAENSRETRYRCQTQGAGGSPIRPCRIFPPRPARLPVRSSVRPSQQYFRGACSVPRGRGFLRFCGYIPPGRSPQSHSPHGCQVPPSRFRRCRKHRRYGPCRHRPESRIGRSHSGDIPSVFCTPNFCSRRASSAA